ncbi:MAG: hypothetical protein M1837_000250 [Sclerophora amabilis]|nr:MAG: hypothetical protein M1837_000250 [Sclerophora amabilis]
MSRSDSGFSDGEASQSELQAAGSKQLEGKTEPFEKGEKVSSGSSGHIKPRSRRTSKSRQRVRSSSASSARPLAEERRGSAAPSSKSTSIRHTSSMEKQVRRPSNKTPTPSIRSATSSRRPTLSTRTTPATTTTTSIDIEKAVAVHQKSCQLFQSLGETISHHHGASANTAPHQHHARTPTATRVADGDISGPTIDRSFTARPRPHADVDVDVDVDVSPSSPILWTSHSTRRQEYAKIDRQHRGLRGWLRRWTPACLHRSSRRRGFYQEGAKMSSDTDSVRRYRLDLPDSPTADEEEKEKKEEEEKWGEEVDGDFREKKRKVPCIKFSWKWGRKPSKQK